MRSRPVSAVLKRLSRNDSRTVDALVLSYSPHSDLAGVTRPKDSGSGGPTRLADDAVAVHGDRTLDETLISPKAIGGSSRALIELAGSAQHVRGTDASYARPPRLSPPGRRRRARAVCRCSSRNMRRWRTRAQRVCRSVNLRPGTWSSGTQSPVLVTTELCSAVAGGPPQLAGATWL